MQKKFIVKFIFAKLKKISEDIEEIGERIYAQNGNQFFGTLNDLVDIAKTDENFNTLSDKEKSDVYEYVSKRDLYYHKKRWKVERERKEKEHRENRPYITNDHYNLEKILKSYGSNYENESSHKENKIFLKAYKDCIKLKYPPKKKWDENSLDEIDIECMKGIEHKDIDELDGGYTTDLFKFLYEYCTGEIYEDYYYIPARIPKELVDYPYNIYNLYNHKKELEEVLMRYHPELLTMEQRLAFIEKYMPFFKNGLFKNSKDAFLRKEFDSKRYFVDFFVKNIDDAFKYEGENFLKIAFLEKKNSVNSLIFKGTKKMFLKVSGDLTQYEEIPSKKYWGYFKEYAYRIIGYYMVLFIVLLMLTQNTPLCMIGLAIATPISAVSFIFISKLYNKILFESKRYSSWQVVTSKTIVDYDIKFNPSKCNMYNSFEYVMNTDVHKFDRNLKDEINSVHKYTKEKLTSYLDIFDKNFKRYEKSLKIRRKRTLMLPHMYNITYALTCVVFIAIYLLYSLIVFK